MSDYRNNNRDRDRENGGSLWRPAYQGNRRRRRYVVKRPVYKQPIVWLLAVAAIGLFLVCGSVLHWGVRDATEQQIGSQGSIVGANASPGPTNAPTNEDGSLAAATSSIEPTATPEPTPSPSPTPNEGPQVWDTANGQSFHFDQNCQGMRNASQESMLTAYNRGLKPCEKCVTSEEAIAARPTMTVKAVTTLPSSLGNVVIQDPQVFDILDIKTQLGSLRGQTALMLSGFTTGSVSLLYTNQPDIYEVHVRAIITDANNNVIWDMDGEPAGYTQAGLDMTREISLVKEISTTDILGAKLTVLVYATQGFAGVDADMAVLGMYQSEITAA